MGSTGKLLKSGGNADILLPLKRAVGFREIKSASVLSHFVLPGPCQAPWVPGKGNVSFQTGSGNLAVLAILLLHHEKSFPPFSEKGDFKISGVHCSASYNDAIESFQVHGMETSLHLPLSSRKVVLSLPQVSAL